jgi:hypothetical protein
MFGDGGGGGGGGGMPDLDFDLEPLVDDVIW